MSISSGLTTNHYLLSAHQIEHFAAEGYLWVKNLIDSETITHYRAMYQAFLSGQINTQGFRSDLSGLSSEDKDKKECITQIMVPSRLQPELLQQTLHQRCLLLGQQLLGADLALDFDMLIDKAPHSNTDTPWHQDAAYWLKLPDTRALSCWVALDDANVDNGCMWYLPKSHLQPIRTHRQINGKGALTCEVNEADAVAVAVNAGDCVIHHGNTAHYSRGNSTDKRRRAFITNYRPQSMINLERSQNYDHTGGRSVKNNAADT